jgi:hypothetical protein
MEHIAFLKKWSGCLKSIMIWEKTIETRWYQTKKAPLNKVNKDDVIYFKEWQNIELKSIVKDVIQYDNLDENKILEIFNLYWKEIKASSFDISHFKNKKYWILIFLKDTEKIIPFQVDKEGFWNMCSWISIDSIDKIKNNWLSNFSWKNCL